MTSHRIGKYACLEVEFRYLLSSVPPGLLDHPIGWRITDRYIPDSRLRLRRMQSLAGDEEIYRLTQKYRSENQSAYETTITNLYLNQAEYQLLVALDARILQKTRYPYTDQSYSFSIDVFEGRHQGLILAEIELESRAEAGALDLIPFALKDVTDDPFFTGGNLAVMADDAFQQGLVQRLHDLENTK